MPTADARMNMNDVFLFPDDGGYVGIPITQLIDKQDIEINDIYLLSFWAKGRGALDVFFYNEATDEVIPDNDLNQSFSNNAVQIRNEWTLHQLGPVVLDTKIEETDTILLVFRVEDPQADYFLDNILLQETTDVFYLKKNSWNTPSACDATLNGTPAPQYHLG